MDSLCLPLLNAGSGFQEYALAAASHAVSYVHTTSGRFAMNIFRIYLDCYRKLYRVLRKLGRPHHDAEEMVQEAFARLLDYMQKGMTVEHPEAFLVQTVRNLDADRRRRERSHLFCEEPPEELLLTSPALSPEEETERDVRLKLIRTILEETAGPRVREVYAMHCQELTYPEIAKQLSISLATVERDVARALYALALSKHRLDGGVKPKE